MTGLQLAPQTERVPSSRADPFLLPSDTAFRFALLVATVLIASLFAFQGLYLLAHRVEFLELSQLCLGGTSTAGWGNTTSPDLATQMADARWMGTCMAGFERAEAGWMLAGVAAVAAVAAVVLLGLARLRTRRGGYVPLERDDAPELAAALDDAARLAGVSGVRFLADPMDGRVSALAYGRPGDRRVVLRGGLLRLFGIDRDAFRAVVLHELAHVRNRDIDQTYLAVAGSVAFVLAAAVPYAAATRGHSAGPGLLLRLAALLGLVALVLLGLLRAREHYADARAAAWGGSEPISRALSAIGGRATTGPPNGSPNGSGSDVGTPEGTPAGGAPGARLRRAFSLHPLAQARTRDLTDAAAAFRLTALDGVLVGLVTSLAVPQAVLLAQLLSGHPAASLRWGAALSAGLASGFLVTGIWRQSYFDAVHHRSRPTWPLGLGFALGLAFGPSLSFLEAIDDDRGRTLAAGAAGQVAWVALVVLLAAPVAAWVGAGAHAACSDRLDRTPAELRRQLRRWCWVSVGLTTVVLTAVLERLQVVRALSDVVEQPSPTGAFRAPLETAHQFLTPTVLRGPGHLATLLAAASLAFVGMTLARRQGRANLLRPALIGLVAAVTVVPADVALTSLRSSARTVAARWPVPFGVDLTWSWIWVACAACLLAAAAAAVSARERALASGAVASGAAVLGSTAVLVVLRPLFSCSPGLSPFPTWEPTCPTFSDGGYTEVVASMVTAGGLGCTLLLLPTILAAGRRFTIRTARRPVPREPGPRTLDHRDGGRPAARRVAALGLAALGVAALGVAALAGWAEFSVGHAVRLAADVPGTIGRDGVVAQDGYAVHLPPGWMDVSAEPALAAKFPDAALILSDTDGDGTIAVYTEADRAIVSEVRAQPDLKPRDAGRADGEPVVEIHAAAAAGTRRRMMVIQHAGDGFLLDLSSTADGYDQDNRSLEKLLRGWRWG